MGLGLGDDTSKSFGIRTNHLLGESIDSCPSDIDTARPGNGFLDPRRMGDLGKLLRGNIPEELIPSVNKPGYQKEGQARIARSRSACQELSEMCPISPTS